jgi:hypothetical protein
MNLKEVLALIIYGTSTLLNEWHEITIPPTAYLYGKYLFLQFFHGIAVAIYF